MKYVQKVYEKILNFFFKPKLRLVENVEYELRDTNGKIKPLFSFNFVGNFLRKAGLEVPKLSIFGTFKEKLRISNLITSAGMAGVASRINGADGEAAFTYIALGTGTTAANAADTTIETEITTGGGARASATCTRETTDVTNDTAQLVETFSFTSTFAVTESGCLNAAANGTLLNRQVFSVINVVSGDSLQVTHKFDVD